MSAYCRECGRPLQANTPLCPQCGGSSSVPDRAGPFLSLSCGQSNASLLFEPGTRLDRFVVRQQLGTGSLGRVYLAEDTVRGHDVAVKVVNVGPCDHDAAAYWLQREREAYDRIQDHRHVLKAYDIYSITWGGTTLLLLSMEHADGGSFRAWLCKHKDDLPRRRTEGLSFFKQACLGLAAIHDAGVVHLDPKPENLLFVGDVLKLSDFSISAFVQNLTLGSASAVRSHLGDLAFGTPEYMSPEHVTCAHPDDLDRHSDIYSMGILLYEILHPKARPPFGGSRTRLQGLHTQVSPPPLPGATEAQSRVIQRCLAKDPADRYESVHEFLADLDGDLAVDSSEDEPVEDSTDDLEEMWEQARDFVEAESFNNALRICRQITEVCPDHADAKPLLAELQERHQQAGELYTAMEAGLEGLGLEELRGMLVEAVETFPDHPRGQVVQVRLEIKARQYRQAMEDGLEATRRGDWEGARASFARAQELNPSASAVRRAVHFVAQVMEFRQEVRRDIDQAVAAGDRRRALGLAEGLDEYLDERSRAVELHGGREAT